MFLSRNTSNVFKYKNMRLKTIVFRRINRELAMDNFIDNKGNKSVLGKFNLYSLHD